jgi:amino acid transporter
LAIASALGGGLASIVASSRILFALCRDLAPKSTLGRGSHVSGTPRIAAVCIVVASLVGYSLMRVVFHASGSDAFFWASTTGALALLVAYLLVAASAAGTLLRSKHPRDQWMLFIPTLGAVAIGYTSGSTSIRRSPGLMR